MAQLHLKAAAQDDWYKTAFVVLMLIPTPLYVTLPYCRYNSSLSLLSLITTVLSAYRLYKVPSGSSLKGTLAIGTVVMAAYVAILGYIKHNPWKGFDYIWVLPGVSAISGVVIDYWIDQLYDVLQDLDKAKYPLKGA